MRSLISLLTFIILTFGCINRQNTKSANEESFPTFTDNSEATNNILNENIQYIGFIDKFYFSNKNEAYVELYFLKDKTNAEEYEKIVKLADSLIYKDDENSRYKFPDHLIQKYFD